MSRVPAAGLKTTSVRSFAGLRPEACCDGGVWRLTASLFGADYYCIQSQLFSHATMNVFQQSRLLWRHTKRISSD